MASLDFSSSKQSPPAGHHNHTVPASQKAFSCVLCAQRKVKCDRRLFGCANCAKAHVPCIYKAPPPARRRKKGERDVDATTRIRLYEDALRQLGVDPENVVKQGTVNVPNDQSPTINDFLTRNGPEKHQASSSPAESGILVSEEGRTRYLENGIWTNLQGEFRDSKDILDDSSDEESSESHYGILSGDNIPNGTDLLFGGQKSLITLLPLHPDPIQIFKLWQVYLDNMNPLVKVFHAPTVQQLILEASGDLANMPRNVEALLFAIYCISSESLSDGECIAVLGQPKSSALRRFRHGAQCAFTNASLLKTSDLMVLQAFTLFAVGNPLQLRLGVGWRIVLIKKVVTAKLRRSCNLDLVRRCIAYRPTYRVTSRWL
jgi:hypothetical protein